jgi:hypothetical protein
VRVYIRVYVCMCICMYSYVYIWSANKSDWYMSVYVYMSLPYPFSSKVTHYVLCSFLRVSLYASGYVICVSVEFWGLLVVQELHTHAHTQWVAVSLLFEIWGSHRSVSTDCSLLGCYVYFVWWVVFDVSRDLIAFIFRVQHFKQNIVLIFFLYLVSVCMQQ